MTELILSDSVDGCMPESGNEGMNGINSCRDSLAFIPLPFTINTTRIFGVEAALPSSPLRRIQLQPMGAGGDGMDAERGRDISRYRLTRP